MIPPVLSRHLMRYRILYYVAFVTTVSLILQIVLAWR